MQRSDFRSTSKVENIFFQWINANEPNNNIIYVIKKTEALPDTFNADTLWMDNVVKYSFI